MYTDLATLCAQCSKLFRAKLYVNGSLPSQDVTFVVDDIDGAPCAKVDPVDDAGNTHITHQHHGRIAALQGAAAVGCRLCRLIADTFFGTESRINRLCSTPQDTADVDSFLGDRDRDARQNYEIVVRRARQYLWDGTAVIDNLADTEARSLDSLPELTVDPVRIDAQTAHVVPELQQIPVLEKLRRWCVECDSHKACCRWQATSFKPTRLLEISADGDEESVKLVPGGCLGVWEKYTTLSHRWGAAGPDLKLTRENLPAFEKGIKLEALPLTFRHAAQVTRSLGIRYLWINALCIIQGATGADQLDWLQEATRMHDVYRHAYLTISAAQANDSTLGLLSPTSSSSVDPLVIESHETLLNTSNTSLPLHHRKSHRSVRTAMIWPTTIESMPINQRGWVLQERLLSTRTLYFANDKVYWECGTMIQDSIEPYPRRFDMSTPEQIGKEPSTHSASYNVAWERLIY
ncbi:hypothetical protein BAUCODRAFT_133934 [Baudoinia panamericana UAMH 10762]|uniref:Heterokaryon incompatibility domain-containing protein n=1 Tax=Baudoinia panamericana (strain UAMH 10762) TaxID=717646 RepID=M2N324_BAUPA|nr:uncharacterized protein BAUCODRAFT_133934 [Baudoinia panamericana UAMH 10762]EMC93075.1 hypothetical protein BAUCODRAFT_133934 [Baudoinia panamericana UAMH 10762]